MTCREPLAEGQNGERAILHRLCVLAGLQKRVILGVGADCPESGMMTAVAERARARAEPAIDQNGESSGATARGALAIAS